MVNPNFDILIKLENNYCNLINDLLKYNFISEKKLQVMSEGLIDLQKEILRNKTKIENQQSINKWINKNN